MQAAFVILEDNDIILHTINGLTQVYNVFTTSLYARSAPLHLEELHVMLKAEEVAINRRINVRNLISNLQLCSLLTFKVCKSILIEGVVVHLIELSMAEDPDVVETLAPLFSLFNKVLMVYQLNCQAKFLGRIITKHWNSLTNQVILTKDSIHQLN